MKFDRNFLKLEIYDERKGKHCLTWSEDKLMNGVICWKLNSSDINTGNCEVFVDIPSSA